MPRAIEDPILAYTAAEGEINQIQWGATQPDWIAICYNRSLEILRVKNRYSISQILVTLSNTNHVVLIRFNRYD